MAESEDWQWSKSLLPAQSFKSGPAGSYFLPSENHWLAETTTNNSVCTSLLARPQLSKGVRYFGYIISLYLRYLLD